MELKQDLRDTATEPLLNRNSAQFFISRIELQYNRSAPVIFPIVL